MLKEGRTEIRYLQMQKSCIDYAASSFLVPPSGTQRGRLALRQLLGTSKSYLKTKKAKSFDLAS